VVEPMQRWPLGDHGDIEERSIECFEYYLENLIQLGMVWEAGNAIGALVWIPRDGADAHREASLNVPGIEVRGHRYDTFWEWIGSRRTDEPLGHLDSIAVEPKARGRGIGSALVEFGLAQARADGVGVHLETGTPRNVPLYERFGFRVYGDADAPGGGPHIWFMRWDP